MSSRLLPASRLGVALWLVTLVAAAVPAWSAAPGRDGPSPRVKATHRGFPGPRPAIKWGRCADRDLRDFGGECGFLSVPLDYANPTGRKIQIAVSRIPAVAPKERRQGVLIGNPGGPGGDGLTTPIFLADRLGAVGEEYDLVGFDPRGVGASRPAITCGTGYFVGPRPPYDPITGPGEAPGPNEQAWLERAAGLSAACAARFPALIQHMRSTDVVADIESLRKALGAEDISFYGISYGAYLGQLYATAHPDRTRRMVLDGVLDPRTAWYQGQLVQSRAMERAIDHFWAWVADHHDVYGLGATPAAVEARYYRDRNRLRARPVGMVGAAEWADVVFGATLSTEDWPSTAEVWTEFVRGNSQPLEDVYREFTEGEDNAYPAYLATVCTDGRWPRTYGALRADGFRTARRAPFATWNNLWFNAPCLTWEAPQSDPAPVDGTEAPGLLLVGTDLDAVTPIEGAFEVRRRFPGSALVVQVGTITHADGLNGNPCIDHTIIRYLADGSLPRRRAAGRIDKRCPASPLPEPAL